MRLLTSLFSLILFACFLNIPSIVRAARCNNIYFNQDARSFFPQFPTGSQSFGIFASSFADINNDGKLDIVAAIRGEGSGRVVTFFGDGTGKFQAAAGGVTQITSNQPFIGVSMKLVEINNDSALDLVVFTGGYIQIYFGNNNGSFTHHSTSAIITLFPFCCASLVDVFDINGDNRKDLVFRETGPKSGNFFIAFVLSSANYDFPLTRSELINGAKSFLVDDFNHDGRKDIAASFNFSPTNNAMRFFYNQGNGAFTQSPLFSMGDVSTLRLAHDFDLNGWKDFVGNTESQNNRPLAILYNNANQGFLIARYPLRTRLFSETFFSLNDFDGDGWKDFAVFSKDDYTMFLRMRVGGFASSFQNIVTHPNLTTDFLHPNVALIADFNRDGSADILRLGTNFIFQTHAFQLYEADCFRRGRPDTIDYIGNARQNFASWQPQTGRWTYTDATEPPTSFSVFWGSGALGDIPVPGDYDGDGVTDPAVFHPQTGTWLVTTKKRGTISFQLGVAGDKPVPADYDGDFKTDFAVFRPAAGDWIIWQSRTQNSLVINFGLSLDKPVPADFDGDRKADVAVFRPAEGTWYYRRSSDGGKDSAQFGQAGDIPQPTDVDGDGRADFNLFRPGNAVFYFASSFDGRNSFVARGQGGVPQPSAGFFINNFYTYHPADGSWLGESIVAQTPPIEIPVSYVLPAGN